MCCDGGLCQLYREAEKNTDAGLDVYIQMKINQCFAGRSAAIAVKFCEGAMLLRQSVVFRHSVFPGSIVTEKQV